MILVGTLTIIGIVYRYQQTNYLNNIGVIVATSTQALSTTSISSSTTQPQTSKNHPGMKLYRNEEFGFEFWYPEGWEWEENVSTDPSNKFNTTVMKIDGENTNQQDSISIVTQPQDFLKYYLINMQRLNAKKSEIMIDNITGTQYRYDFEGMKMVDVFFPLHEFIVLFGVEGQHEVGLKSILSTFKFTK